MERGFESISREVKRLAGQGKMVFFTDQDEVDNLRVIARKIKIVLRHIEPFEKYLQTDARNLLHDVKLLLQHLENERSKP